MFKAESYVGHKICRPGDLAVNTMWVGMAALGVSRHEGIVSPAYAVYRQRSKTRRLLNQFADLLLRTQPYKIAYLFSSTGVRVLRLRPYPEEFLKIPILIPPLEEQQTIVDSITAETNTCNSTITDGGRQIALVQEYRTRLDVSFATGKLNVVEAANQLADGPSVALSGPVVDESLDEADAEELND